MTEYDEEVVKEIGVLEEAVKEGTFVPQGRDDILSRAIGKEEHPGRVRGVTNMVNISDVFGRSTKKMSEVKLENTVRTMQSQMFKMSQMFCKFVAGDTPSQEDMKTFMSMMNSHDSQAREDNEEDRVSKDSNNVLRKGKSVSLNEDHDPPASHSSARQVPQTSTSSIQHTIEGGPVQGWHKCQMSLPSNPQEIVALGEVYVSGNSELILLHNNIVPSGYSKVSISKDLVPNAELPVPTPEACFLSSTVGGYVLWPSPFIFPLTNTNDTDNSTNKHNTSPTNTSTPTSTSISSSKDITTEDKMKMRRTVLMRWLCKEARKMKKSGSGKTLHVPEHVLYNMQDLYVTPEEMEQWCYQWQIQSTHITTFIL